MKHDFTNQIDELNNIIKNKNLIIKDLNEGSKMQLLNLQEKNIDIYYLDSSIKKLLNKVAELEKETNKQKSENKKEIQKIFSKEVNDKFTQLIESENIYSFIENWDNFKSIIYIVLIADGNKFDEIEKNYNSLISKIIDKLNDKNFYNFLNFIITNNKDWNRKAHDGYEKEIINNLFKLCGKSNEFKKEYNSFFLDELIKKTKEIIRKKLKEKNNNEPYVNFEEDYLALENDIKNHKNKDKILKK